MQLTINVSDQIAKSATRIYDALGIDLETAVKMFLKSTVLEQRLPLNTKVPTSVLYPKIATNEDTQSKDTQDKPPQTGGAITEAMARDVWQRFERFMREGGNLNSMAQAAHEATGMNPGSAFIYLNFLNNLVNGKPNTRNMKMSALEYFVRQIQNTYNTQIYYNVINSLKLSIPYWEKEGLGQYVGKVADFVAKLER